MTQPRVTREDFPWAAARTLGPAGGRINISLLGAPSLHSDTSLRIRVYRSDQPDPHLESLVPSTVFDSQKVPQGMLLNE